jgi:membrane protease subunit (stomatin/prohibitin family)
MGYLFQTREALGVRVGVLVTVRVSAVFANTALRVRESR